MREVYKVSYLLFVMKSIDKTISKDQLYNLYWKENKSTSDIAKIYGINSESIRRRMIKYNIKRRELHKRKFKISKRELTKFYNGEKLSTITLAQNYGCSQWTIWNLMKLYGIKRRNSYSFHKWKEVGNLIKPHFEDLQTLSYVIGVLLGDGWIYNKNHTYFISLEANDKFFCNNFKMALSKLNLNPCMFVKKKGWRVVATSKLFYLWVKSLTIKKIRKFVLKYPHEFLRGFYESEGCLYIVKSGKKSSRLKIVMVNTRKDLIILTKDLLKIFDFTPKIHISKSRNKNWKSIWVLGLYRQKEVLRFLKDINPSNKNLENLRNHKFYKYLNLNKI